MKNLKKDQKENAVSQVEPRKGKNCNSQEFLTRKEFILY